MGKRGDNPRETPAAAQAFRDYVALGPDRSLTALAATYRVRIEPGPTRHLSTLRQWSMDHGWQARLRDAVNAETAAMLEEAGEIDARSFRATSELIAKRLAYTDPGHIDVVVKIRESVRKPAPKGTVAVEHSGTVAHAHTHRVYDFSRFSPEEQAQIDDLAARYDGGKGVG